MLRDNNSGPVERSASQRLLFIMGPEYTVFYTIFYGGGNGCGGGSYGGG